MRMRLVMPLGARRQRLWVFERRGDDVARRALFPVQFVPLVGD